MAGTGHFTGVNEGTFNANVSRQSSYSMNLVKVMGLSIVAYLAAPVLMFFAADRAFDSNWPGVAGFLLEAAGCVLLGRMMTWAGRNL